MDERGYFTITGRLKELIIRGGENIAPAEIESHLAGRLGIADCAVIGLPDDRLGEIVAAVVRPTDDSVVPEKQALTDYLRDRLAPYKVPARWFTTAEFPVTPTGKVRKFELRDAVIRGTVAEL
jgi:fatty-acyl-CoA synthase